MAGIEAILSETSQLTGLELKGKAAVLELQGAVVSLGETAGRLVLHGPVAAYSAADHKRLETALRCNLSLTASGESASIGLTSGLGLYVLSKAYPLENLELDCLADMLRDFVALELNLRAQMNQEDLDRDTKNDGGLSSFQLHFKELYG